jgi:hypothetical protein
MKIDAFLTNLRCDVRFVSFARSASENQRSNRSAPGKQRSNSSAPDRQRNNLPQLPIRRPAGAPAAAGSPSISGPDAVISAARAALAH